MPRRDDGPLSRGLERQPVAELGVVLEPRVHGEVGGPQVGRQAQASPQHPLGRTVPTVVDVVVVR
eukprot:2477333-Alexandrium_andersonii.AAC.1